MELATRCLYRLVQQTGFYCLEIPQGRSAEARPFIQNVAERLNFKISEGTIPAEIGASGHEWEVYGRGVSMFVDSAMQNDRLENRTTFDPHLLDLQIVKTGWWRRVRFEDVFIAARDSAGQLGWRLSKATADQNCST